MPDQAHGGAKTVSRSAEREPKSCEVPLSGMATGSEVEFIFEPAPDGGYHAYAQELPGLHIQGDALDEALVNAREALHLCIEGLGAEGRSLDMRVVRRALPARAGGFRSSPGLNWSQRSGKRGWVIVRQRGRLAGILRDADVDTDELRELL